MSAASSNWCQSGTTAAICERAAGTIQGLRGSRFTAAVLLLQFIQEAEAAGVRESSAAVTLSQADLMYALTLAGPRDPSRLVCIPPGMRADVAALPPPADMSR
jgi:hypothetical protein